MFLGLRQVAHLLLLGYELISGIIILLTICHERIIFMKNSVLLCVVFFSYFIVGSANATILTFDDITEGAGAPVSSYGGLTWNNVSVIYAYTEIFGILDHGYKNGVVSGDYVAFNNYGETANVTNDGELFDFNGAYLTAAWNNGLNITVVGKLEGAEIYNQTVTVDIYSPTWFSFNFFGIDELEFLSSGGKSAFPNHPGSHQFAMDNFTFNGSPTPVPEPATVLLLCSGLIGIAGFRKKFEK